MKTDRYVAGGVPVIRGNNISATRSFKGEFVYVGESTADELRSSNVFAGDLVFPHRGAIGGVGIYPRINILDTFSLQVLRNSPAIHPLSIPYSYFTFSVTSQ